MQLPLVETMEHETNGTVDKTEAEETTETEQAMETDQAESVETMETETVVAEKAETEAEPKEAAETESANTTITSDGTPANTSITEMTSEDKVKQLEELFKDRYTENDKDYAACLNKEDQKPPLVADFGHRSDNRPARREDDRSTSNTRHRSRSRTPEKPPKRVGKHGILSFYSLYY